MPSLGVKMDAIPGRLNETYFNIKEEGMYYGQCSELCGIGHGFMPITIKAVSDQEFATWLVEAKELFANDSLENKDIVSK
jgi:cytochrome c oxidase subunit 2